MKTFISTIIGLSLLVLTTLAEDAASCNVNNRPCEGGLVCLPNYDFQAQEWDRMGNGKCIVDAYHNP
ncbi:hypothetical protein [Parasitella parasitica]|uniref:Uncharacterized protein n=1 Tax=Parasitella parasitica TaxID=35722 RepID=A0A0B7N0T1_9FUNG|nr:hypothetical protein [Parasitella parasitica]